MDSPETREAQRYSEQLRAFLDCYGAFREISASRRPVFISVLLARSATGRL